MKELWLELDPKLDDQVKTQLVKLATDARSPVVTSTKDSSFCESVGAIIVSEAPDAAITLLARMDHQAVTSFVKNGKRVAVEFLVSRAEDEAAIAEAATFGAEYAIIECPNWKVIPLENLIAKTRGRIKLLAKASNSSEAKLALETLELGTDGVVLRTREPAEFQEVLREVSQSKPALELVEAKVTDIKSLGSGARVCIDTCELLEPGEGVLVGSQSSGLFLLEGEIHRNPHVEPRPFRVNAGPVSLYVLRPSNKTGYLSELSAGEEVLLVNRRGRTRVTHVARVKIERRPMTLVRAEHNGTTLSTIVQTAETIRFVTSQGSKALNELAPGDTVLVRVEKGGRHFGSLVKDEMVVER